MISFTEFSTFISLYQATLKIEIAIKLIKVKSSHKNY